MQSRGSSYVIARRATRTATKAAAPPLDEPCGQVSPLAGARPEAATSPNGRCSGKAGTRRAHAFTAEVVVLHRAPAGPIAVVGSIGRLYRPAPISTLWRSRR